MAVPICVIPLLVSLIQRGGSGLVDGMGQSGGDCVGMGLKFLGRVLEFSRMMRRCRGVGPAVRAPGPEGTEDFELAGWPPDKVGPLGKGWEGVELPRPRNAPFARLQNSNVIRTTLQLFSLSYVWRDSILFHGLNCQHLVMLFECSRTDPVLSPVMAIPFRDFNGGDGFNTHPISITRKHSLDLCGHSGLTLFRP